MSLKLASKALLFAAGFVLAVAPAHAVDKASAVLKDASGKEVGKAELTDTPSGVLIRLDLTGIPPGDHAFHVHAIGKCDGAGLQVGRTPFQSRRDQARADE